MDVWGFLTLVAIVAAVAVAVLSRSVATIVAGSVAIVVVVTGALINAGGPASAPWTLAALLVTGGGLVVAALLDRLPVEQP